MSESAIGGPSAATVEDFFVPEETEEQTPVETGAEGESAEEALVEELAAIEPEAEVEAPAEPVPPPPNSWSKEDAEAWKDLTPAARDVVMRREAERDKFVAGKGREVAEAKRQVEAQAMQTLAQQAEQFAQQLQAYQQQNLPAPPNPQLLYTGDQNDVLVYQRQDAAYRAGLAQQQELQQKIGLSQQQADQARRQVAEQQTVAEAERLREALPEFFDDEAGPKLRQTLESIGQKLGYQPELMAQAGASDILALKTAAEWHDKAMQFDKIMAKRMETVRGAKTLPKMTRPAGGQSQSVAQEASRDRETAAIQSFNRDRSADAAAALLMVRKR